MENNECIVEPFKKEYLEKKHTKQLLRILNNQRRHPSSYCFDYCVNSGLCKKVIENNAILIKDILATRPHIPNKKESKIIRKAKIKKGV